MEFDEIKKVWDEQNDQPLYVIDEKALQNQLQTKRTSFFVNIADWILIISYLATVGLLVGVNPFTPAANTFLHLEAAWMFIMVVYFVVSHIRRIKAGRRFDRSIHGDLDHAIYLISYQMRSSQITRWGLLPVGALMILSGWEAGKLLLVSALILVCYTLTYYANLKWYRANKRRKHKLQALKEKLENASL